jgi:hypothetical protein
MGLIEKSFYMAGFAFTLYLLLINYGYWGTL